MFEGQRKAMDAHAVEAWPRAVCGAILRTDDGLDYRPVFDIANNSRQHFRLGPDALATHEADLGELAAVVYSHPCSADTESDMLLHTPSAAQMREQLRLAVPFGILVCRPERVIDRFWFGDPCPVEPLLGRPFRHGVWDCYSVVRDWYRLEQDLVLPEFPRDWNWWVHGLDMYSQGFEKVGFQLIDREDAGPGDAALFRIRARVPNHAAVLEDDEWLVHHPGSTWPFDVTRVSHLDRVSRWERFATHWLRPPSA